MADITRRKLTTEEETEYRCRCGKLTEQHMAAFAALLTELEIEIHAGEPYKLAGRKRQVYKQRSERMSIRTAHEAGKGRAERVEKWDRRFMGIAEQVAGWSKDPGHKVGAVLTRDNVIVATGYNGFPRSMLDIDLHDRDNKLSRTIHAEMNALLNALHQNVNVRGCTLYVTPLLVCEHCAVHLTQAGIERVVMRPPPTLTLQAGSSEIQWVNSGERALRYFDECDVRVTLLERCNGTV